MVWEKARQKELDQSHGHPHHEKYCGAKNHQGHQKAAHVLQNGKVDHLLGPENQR